MGPGVVQLGRSAGAGNTAYGSPAGLPCQAERHAAGQALLGVLLLRRHGQGFWAWVQARRVRRLGGKQVCR